MTGFPRLNTSREHGAIMPLADAVQKMHVDLAMTVLHAKARRGSKKLEQVVSELRRVNTQTHSRSSPPIGSRRSQMDRLHEGKLVHARSVLARACNYGGRQPRLTYQLHLRGGSNYALADARRSARSWAR